MKEYFLLFFLNEGLRTIHMEKSISSSSNTGDEKWLVHQFRNNGGSGIKSIAIEGTSTSLSVTDPIAVRIETALVEALLRGDFGIALRRHCGWR